MGEAAIEQMIQSMLANLEQSGTRMDGLSLDDLRAAMSHPDAPAFLAEWMPVEAASVKPGEAAPDFTLPYLPGQAPTAGDEITLSAHFGRRPVALVFGSYT